MERKPSTVARVATAVARAHPAGTRGARQPSVAPRSAPRRAFRAGCPSFGGQRTDFCPFANPLPRCSLPRHLLFAEACCAHTSAWAVRPLAASEPVFARHRHHLRSPKHRALWKHRHRSSTFGGDSQRRFRWSVSGPERLPLRTASSTPRPVLCHIGSTIPSCSRIPVRAQSQQQFAPSNTLAVLPNPSFNLTRSGLRPPRAS
jgi:hypothetical protein